MRRQSYGIRYICFHRAREKWSVPNDPHRKWNITEFIQNTLKNVEIALFMNSIVAHFLRKQSIIVFQRNNCCCFLASKSASSLFQTIFLSLFLSVSRLVYEKNDKYDNARCWLLNGKVNNWTEWCVWWLKMIGKNFHFITTLLYFRWDSCVECGFVCPLNDAPSANLAI